MARKYITQDRLKKNTLSDIFIFILEKKQTTRREIEYETGFSWGTVSSNVAFLIEKGYITEEKSEQNGLAGRTTYLLKPTKSHTVSLGLDINRSGISCEVIALNACVKKKFQQKFASKTQNEVINQSEELCREAIDWCNQNKLHIFSLGIAIQGKVNGRLGISTGFPNIGDWSVINLKEHFSEKFALPVYLGHDPKCMLLGEAFRQKCGDCVLVRIDDGIGMAVALDGKILDDTERFELGHTLSVVNGRKCTCGRLGCLEAYSCLPAIAAETCTDTDALFDSTDNYITELEEAGNHLSRALYNAYTLFKPQKLILTGKAVALTPFIEKAIAPLSNEFVDIIINPEISAAYGAAVESIKSAIKSYLI